MVHDKKRHRSEFKIFMKSWSWAKSCNVFMSSSLIITPVNQRLENSTYFFKGRWKLFQKII